MMIRMMICRMRLLNCSVMMNKFKAPEWIGFLTQPE